MKAPIHDLHVSNLLTYAALLAAVGAVLLAMTGQYAQAAAAIGFAVIADTFDGRFARLFTRTAAQQAHGKEIDSLVDVVAFGVAPSVVLLGAAGLLRTDVSGFGGLRLVGLSAALFYALAAVTRLAHYNVADDDTRFVGLPTPAAALLCVTSLLIPTPAWAALLPLIAGGTAMIAPFAFPRPRGIGLALFACWAIAVVGLHATG